MSEGVARHPATQACQSSLTDSTEPALQACLNILSAVSTVRFSPPATEADANAALEKDYLARLALLAHALSNNVDELDPLSHPRVAARALGKHEQLSRLPQLIHRGQAVFSEARYRQHDIRPSDLAGRIRIAGDATAGPRTTGHTGTATELIKTGSLNSIPIVSDKPGRQALLNAAVADAFQEFSRTLADGETRQRYRQTELMPLWRLVVLRERQLALWQKCSPDLLRERSTLTPLHKLFHAWRNRR